MGQKEQEFRPNVVLASAIYSGLSALVNLAYNRKSSLTATQFDQIREIWDKARKTKKQKKKILKEIITCNRHVSNRELRNIIDISPQKLSYHIKQLSKKGFVSTQRGFDKMTKRGEVVRDTRILDISITNAGRLVANMTTI